MPNEIRSDIQDVPTRTYDEIIEDGRKDLDRNLVNGFLTLQNGPFFDYEIDENGVCFYPKEPSNFEISDKTLKALAEKNAKERREIAKKKAENEAKEILLAKKRANVRRFQLSKIVDFTADLPFRVHNGQGNQQTRALAEQMFANMIVNGSDSYPAIEGRAVDNNGTPITEDGTPLGG